MIDASHLTDKVQTVPFCDFLLSSEPPSELKDRGVGVWLTSVLKVPLSHKLNSQLLFDVTKDRMSHTAENYDTRTCTINKRKNKKFLIKNCLDIFEFLF